MEHYRTTTRASLYAFLQAQQTAAGLRQVYKARPPDFGSCPCAYVGGMPEPSIRHTQGIRIRQMEPNIVIVDELSDNEETAARLDFATDILMNALSAAPHVVEPNTVTEPTRVDTAELDVGGVMYAANVIVLPTEKQEGLP
jgi:hypothetical protein